MDSIVLRIFQREVERQCTFALIAAQDLEHALEAGYMDHIWCSVQALLVAAGNVSQLLWPTHARLPERGAELRASLAVGDHSPLQPRTFRNHFEHFDERLEQWATASQRQNFVDQNVGPPGMIAGLDPGDTLRNLDATTMAVTFRGDAYPLQPIVKAIRELRRQAAGFDKVRRRWAPCGGSCRRRRGACGRRWTRSRRQRLVDEPVPRVGIVRRR